MKRVQSFTLATLLVVAMVGCGEMRPEDEGVAVTRAPLTAGNGGGADLFVASHGPRYIVAFNDLARGVRALERAGATVALSLPSVGAAAAYIPDGALAGIERSPNVRYVEPDEKRYPSAELTPYGISMIQADQLSDSNAASVMACIIDSGVNAGHEDLPGAIGGDGSQPMVDKCGHGTHVLGTVAALGGNGKGVVGILPGGGVNLHVVKVFGDDCGWVYASGLVGALQACIDASNLPTVVNMSLGGGHKSRTEEAAFQNAFDSGRIVPVAAAGNDGSSRKSYPASYAGVISVAAIDSTETRASFSQYNAEVELAAPGVLVRSTMMPGAVDYAPDATLSVGGQPYEALAMTGAPARPVTGPLVSCEASGAGCASAGSICLIPRGANISFADKAAACLGDGGVGAVIYNDEPGLFAGTLGDPPPDIPTVSLSQEDGNTLLGEIGKSTTIVIDATQPYTVLNGTSMATPHVTGAAALLWSMEPGLTSAEVRGALDDSAKDLGALGRDSEYGYGLVQVADAVASFGAPCGADSDCDDANACNGDETCNGGKCQPGTPVVCADDGNACTSSSCDPDSGTCSTTSVSDGTSCSDGVLCNGDETCQAGTCTSGDVPVGADCGDGNACNGYETCQSDGTCGSGTPVSCASGETCDPDTGACAPITCVPTGGSCGGATNCCSGVCFVGGGKPRCG